MGLSHSAPAAPKTIVITDPGTSEWHRHHHEDPAPTTTTTVTTTDPLSAPTGYHDSIDQGSGTTLDFNKQMDSGNTYVNSLT